MKERKRFQKIDVIVFLEVLYCAICAVLSQLDLLYGMPLMAKILMIGASASGIIIILKSDMKGAYLRNKLMLGLFIFGFVLWNAVMFIRPT